MSYIKIACLGDQHIPYMDDKAHRATVKLLQNIKPNKIIFMGDMIDFSQTSKFLQDPSNKIKLQDDCNKGKDYLYSMRELFPTAEMIYLFGNHEMRLRKYIWRVAPELDSLKILCLEELLELNKMKIKYYNSDADVHREGVLLFTHGTRYSKHSGYTAKILLESKGMSSIQAHSHRLGSHFRTDHSGTYGAWENGCLCQFELSRQWGQGYPPNWQHGLNIVFMRSYKLFHTNQIYIHNGGLVFGGEGYSYKDEVEEDGRQA